MCLGAPLPQAAAPSFSNKSISNVPMLGLDFLELEKPFVQDFKPVEVPEKAPIVPPAGVSHTDVDDQLLGKTKLCKFFSRGFCSKGRQCTFAHGRKELKPAPNLYKTEMCFEFASTGRCMRGNACKYAHLQEELRNPAPQAPAAKNAKVRRGSQEKVLSLKLEAMEKEAEQLRAQLKALEVMADKTQSSTASSGSTYSEDFTSSETPRSSSCESFSMDEEEVEVESRLEITRTSINLVPAARSQRRSKSVPRSMC